jgi:hypothetical protein
MAIRHADTPRRLLFHTRSTHLRPLLLPGRRIASLGHGLLPLLPTAPQRRTGLCRMRNPRGGAGARTRGRAPGVRRAAAVPPRGGARTFRPSPCPQRAASPAQAGQGDPLRLGRAGHGGRGGGVRAARPGRPRGRPGLHRARGPDDLRPSAAAVRLGGGGAFPAYGQAGFLSGAWAGFRFCLREAWPGGGRPRGTRSRGVRAPRECPCPGLDPGHARSRALGARAV